MPFENKSQLRACFAKKDPKWDCHKWAHETPNLKDIPNKPKKKKKKKAKCFKEWLTENHPGYDPEDYGICSTCQEEVPIEDLDDEGVCSGCRSESDRKWEPIK